MRAARQLRGEIDFTIINHVHYPLALACLLLLPLIGGYMLRRKDVNEIGELATACLFALLANAFVCGSFSPRSDKSFRSESERRLSKKPGILSPPASTMACSAGMKAAAWASRKSQYCRASARSNAEKRASTRLCAAWVASRRCWCALKPVRRKPGRKSGRCA